MALKSYQYVEGSYDHLESTQTSALEIVPDVIKLVQPKSVIDLGCGIGIWLSVFKKLGVEDVIGVDGDWVDKKRLKIPKECFISADLRQPFNLEKQFDLAVSVETAEHLPIESAEHFVDSLVKLAPVVLFSAAAPLVPGNMHINCQWPSYWVKHFDARGYITIDCIREKVWSSEKVMWCYSQGILVFVRKEVLKDYLLLEIENLQSNLPQLDVIHPKCYLKLVKQLNTKNGSEISLSKLISSLPLLGKIYNFLN